MNYIRLDVFDVLVAGVLMLANAGLSVALDLGIARKMLVAAARMVVQLLLVGLVLTWLFATKSPWLTLGIALVMVLFAGHEIVARQDRRFTGWWGYGLGTGSMLLAAGVVTVFGLTTQLRPDPWYDPRYAIPLLGMVLGNTMTGIALGMNTLTVNVRLRRAAIEARLALGDDRREALAPVVRQSLSTALTPIINTMAATGLVSLPGMMTGQILGGVEPVEAVKYQILILFLIAGGTGLGAVAAVLGGARRLTDHRQRIRLDRLE
jgi:putative ABC transport system permease protein